MTWNDRWQTKIFLGGKGTARWNGSEMDNLNKVIIIIIIIVIIIIILFI